MFYDEVTFMKLTNPPFVTIKRFSTKLYLEAQVNSQQESIKLARVIKKILLSHFVRFAARFEQDDRIKYIAQFCSDCKKQNSLPLNRCVLQCKFEPKTMDSVVTKLPIKVRKLPVGPDF